MAVFYLLLVSKFSNKWKARSINFDKFIFDQKVAKEDIVDLNPSETDRKRKDRKIRSKITSAIKIKSIKMK